MAAPSWSVLDQSNRYRDVRQAKLRAEYEMWRSCQPLTTEREGEDWTALTAELYAKIGVMKYQITRNLDALDVLDRLPRLKEFVESTFLLDMNHLCGIEKAVSSAAIALQDDPFFWKAVDEDLMARLTPSRPLQLVPSTSTIADTIRNTIRSVEELAAPQTHPWGDREAAVEDGPVPCENPGELMSTLPPPEEPPGSTLIAEDLSNGDIRIELITDQATGTQILAAVDEVAAERKSSKADALTTLILDDVSTRVTLNLYQSEDEGVDEEDCVTFHPERGLLTLQAAAALRKRVTRTISMRHAKTAATRTYQPTPPIRAYLVGRDWICRWPGCNRKATHCDADHRVNHADGGPTTAANMVMLCRHHHNRKTDEVIRYIVDHHTGDVTWLFADGTYAVDEATGPWPRSRSTGCAPTDSAAVAAANTWRARRPPRGSSATRSGTTHHRRNRRSRTTRFRGCANPRTMTRHRSEGSGEFRATSVPHLCPKSVNRLLGKPACSLPDTCSELQKRRKPVITYQSLVCLCRTDRI